MYDSLFYRSDPLLVCLVLLGLLLAAKEIGFRLARRTGRLPGLDDKDIPLILGAVLTLLSLMLAFTYSVSNAHFERRRQLVIDEAGTISTVYRRAQVMPQPVGGEIQELCRQYGALRLELASVDHDNSKKIKEFDVRSRQLLDMMWSQAASLAKESPTATVSLLLQALNELSQIHGRRLAAYRSRVHLSIYIVLFTLSAVAVGLAGLHFGAHPQRRDVLTLVFTILVAMTMWLILDLDSPMYGTIRVGQHSFTDLQQEIGPPTRDALKLPD
jgi:hypothetical protein